MTMVGDIHGQCLCGAVRYRAQPPTLFCAHCHCWFCRVAHGAAFVTWVGVPEAAFEFTAGGDRVRWFASSRQSRRGFCTECGTTLFFQSTVSPGEMHIALGTVVGSIDRQPQAHVFFDQRVPWLAVVDELPKFDTDSPELAAYRQIES